MVWPRKLAAPPASKAGASTGSVISATDCYWVLEGGTQGPGDRRRWVSTSRRLSALGSGPSSAALIQVPTPVSKPKPLTDAELDEIERMARTAAAEAYRGPLLALVDEVRRLWALALQDHEAPEK